MQQQPQQHSGQMSIPTTPISLLFTPRSLPKGIATTQPLKSYASTQQQQQQQQQPPSNGQTLPTSDSLPPKQMKPPLPPPKEQQMKPPKEQQMKQQQQQQQQQPTPLPPPPPPPPPTTQPPPKTQSLIIKSQLPTVLPPPTLPQQQTQNNLQKKPTATITTITVQPPQTQTKTYNPLTSKSSQSINPHSNTIQEINLSQNNQTSLDETDNTHIIPIIPLEKQIVTIPIIPLEKQIVSLLQEKCNNSIIMKHNQHTVLKLGASAPKVDNKTVKIIHDSISLGSTDEDVEKLVAKEPVILPIKTRKTRSRKTKITEPKVITTQVTYNTDGTPIVTTLPRASDFKKTKIKLEPNSEFIELSTEEPLQKKSTVITTQITHTVDGTPIVTTVPRGSTKTKIKLEPNSEFIELSTEQPPQKKIKNHKKTTLGFIRKNFTR